MSLYFDLQLPRRDFLLDLKGEFGKDTIGVFGPSGAGKTSFFSLLAGLEHPVRGRIVLNGRVLIDVEKNIFIPVQKRRIGVVFQEKRIFPHLTIKENLLFGERYTKEKKIALQDAVELLDLSPLLDAMPHEVSGGEQQRTAIGRALLTSPELLLLDEPFNAVDSSLRTKILPYLKRLGEELELPMLVISHDLPDIQRLTGNIFLIDRGRCSGFGDIMEIFSQGEDIPGKAEPVNAFELYQPEQTDPGLYSCSVKGMARQKIRVPSLPSDRFRAVIPPNEIALSRGTVKNISLQNQLHGTIRKLVYKDELVFCFIDMGIFLAAEVTHFAVKEMGLREGMDIVCMFKACSLVY